MAFDSYEFIFNGKSCTQYGLMLYDVDGKTPDGGEHTSSGDPQVEIVYRSQSYLLRGVEQKDPLTFNLQFGLCPERLNRMEYLTRSEIAKIAAWLTGQDSWGWLSICQPDLKNVRYKCIIKNLKELTNVWDTYGFSCTVVCDSPYAYMTPVIYSYRSEGNLDVNIFSHSSMNRPYSPVLEIENLTSANFSIVNKTHGGVGPRLENVPTVKKIIIDNSTGIVTFVDSPINPYQFYNFEVLRLVRGRNLLTVSGRCEIKIKCEYPVDVGA